MNEVILKDFVQEFYPPIPQIPQGFYPYNPSILSLPNGNILINIRLTNYFYKGNFMTKTIIQDHGPRYVTKNILCCYGGDDFSLLWHRPIEDLWGQYFYNRSYEHGLQDIRLFLHQGEVRFSTNIVMVEPEFKIWVYEGSLGKMDELYSTCDPIYIVWLHKLEGPYSNLSCEKNWLPISIDEKIWYVYHIGKEIWINHGQDGELRRIINKSKSKQNYNFSGSSPPIVYKDGFLIMAHKVYSAPQGGRIYKHCFVQLNCNREIIKVSGFFSLNQIGVEYALSMTWWKEDLLIPFSVNDNDIIFFLLSTENLDHILSLP